MVPNNSMSLLIRQVILLLFYLHFFFIHHIKQVDISFRKKSLAVNENFIS